MPTMTRALAISCHDDCNNSDGCIEGDRRLIVKIIMIDLMAGRRQQTSNMQEQMNDWQGGRAISTMTALQ